MSTTYCPYCDSDIDDDLYAEWSMTGLVGNFKCGYCGNELAVEIRRVPEFVVSRIEE